MRQAAEAPTPASGLVPAAASAPGCLVGGFSLSRGLTLRSWRRLALRLRQIYAGWGLLARLPLHANTRKPGLLRLRFR